MNYINCHNKNINFYKKFFKQLILCLFIQILFYTCTIIYRKSIPEFVNTIIGLIEGMAMFMIIAILISVIYRIKNNLRKNKYSYLFKSNFYQPEVIFGTFIIFSLGVAFGVTFLLIEEVNKYTKAFLKFSIAFNILMLFYNVCRIYKIKQNIKYEEKLESELQIYKNDLSKFLQVPFEHSQQIYVDKPLFIIETDYNAEEKVGFISKLNFKLTPEYICKNPNHAKYIILLEKNRYEINKYCYTDYYAKFLRTSEDHVLKYYGGIKYHTSVKNEGIASDFFFIKQAEELADEEFIYFIFNFQFYKVKHLDYNSDNVRELKGYWPNGNLMFKGDYNFLAESKYANWTEFYENGKLKNCIENGEKKEYDLNGWLKTKYIPYNDSRNIG